MNKDPRQHIYTNAEDEDWVDVIYLALRRERSR